MKNLGWLECDVRFVEPENIIIALIEHNRHRIKTVSDILNEARYLGEELQKWWAGGETLPRNDKDGASKRLMKLRGD